MYYTAFENRFYLNDFYHINNQLLIILNLSKFIESYKLRYYYINN